MKKEQFLQMLRQALSGEVDPNTIEYHLKYYDEYIGNVSRSEEEEKLEQLGDPRLIAKTIIEAERVAKQKNGFYNEHKYYNEHTEWNGKEAEHKKDKKHKNYIFYNNFKWYHKLILVFGGLMLFLLLIIIIGLMLRFIFIFSLPILIILLILFLIKKR